MRNEQDLIILQIISKRIFNTNSLLLISILKSISSNTNTFGYASTNFSSRIANLIANAREDNFANSGNFEGYLSAFSP